MPWCVANGNLVNDSMGRQFTWNAQNQLSQMQFPTVSALMGYDPLGRRTSYTKGSTLKTYFYLGQSMLNDGTSKFLHGSGIDQPLQVDSPTGSLSYLQDHLGSTSQLVDTLNASNKARYDYKSYGKLEGDGNNPLAANPFTYTGREDDGTGLIYYRARYYDPELEVFISQDPLGDAQRYVGGNPLNFLDPLGLYSVNLITDGGHPITNWNVEQLANMNGGINKKIDVLSPQAVKSALDAAIVEAQQKYPGEPLSNVNFYGHGSEGGIGSGGQRGEITMDPTTLNQAFSPIKGNRPVTITLYSCHTGGGDFGNIAKSLSQVSPNFVVKAPNVYIIPIATPLGPLFSEQPLIGPVFFGNQENGFKRFVGGKRLD